MKWGSQGWAACANRFASLLKPIRPTRKTFLHQQPSQLPIIRESPIDTNPLCLMFNGRGDDDTINRLSVMFGEQNCARAERVKVLAKKFKQIGAWGKK
jgi:hypothetical protein